VFEFGGHGEEDGAEGIAGGAKGIGDLFGMAALLALAATGTIAGLDVELGDDKDNGRQVGLILDDDFGIDERHLTVGARAAGDVDDAVDMLGLRRGAVGRRMAFTAAGALLAFQELPAAEARGLAVGSALQLLGLLAEAEVLVLELGDAVLQALAVAVALAPFDLQAVDVPLALLAARTDSLGEYHDDSAQLGIR
jgi:hypothetical protein